MSNNFYNDPLKTFYGQVDCLQFNLSPQARKDFDQTIECLGDVKFLSISLATAFTGIAISMDVFFNAIKQPNLLGEGLFNRFVSLQIEVSEISEEVEFRNFSTVQVSSKHRMWQLFTKVGKVESIFSDDLKAHLGAYILLRINGQSVRKDIPAILFKFSNGGKDALRADEWKALNILLTDAQKAFFVNDPLVLVEDHQNVEDLFRKLFRNKVNFADPKVRQGAMDFKTLTIPKFLEMAAKLRLSCEAGSNYSAKVLIAAFVGIPFKHIDKVPLLLAEADDWVLVLDVDQAVIKFNLDLISPLGAEPAGIDYVRSSTILVKPLPEFLASFIRAKYSENHQSSSNIGQLLASDETLEYSYEIIAKFINSVARVAILHCNIDPFQANLIANDFRILPTSKGYYRQSTRQSVWNDSANFFSKVGWGAPAPFVDGLNFGSRAVLTDDAVQQLFYRLAAGVHNSRVSNNADVTRLFEFHNKFTIYVASLSVFCLVMRESKRLKIYADSVGFGQRCVLINDKNVHDSASLQPVTINRVLQEQFSLYISHCHSLLNRLTKHGNTHRSFIKGLREVVSRQHAPLFITIDQPLGISTAFLTKSWGENVVENFGRHYWETNFHKPGITSRESAAHLRHQSSGSFNWDGATDLVLGSLIERIDEAQVEQLNSLHIKAIPGLSKRITT